MSSRRSRSTLAKSVLKSGPVNGNSSADWPLPFQSVNSARAWCSTSSGMAPGPAEKLNTRALRSFPPSLEKREAMLACGHEKQQWDRKHCVHAGREECDSGAAHTLVICGSNEAQHLFL